MHRCLNTLETVEMVCAELLLLPAPGSLAAFARTCKAIEDPALNRLWHDQADMHNILCCMPDDLFRLWTRKAPAGGRIKLCTVRYLFEQ
jgi:hypothetical protein